MKIILSGLLCFVFVVLALIHAYWALGGNGGKSAAVPHINEMPAFRPSPGGTFLVATALLACALLIASVSDFVLLPVPRKMLTWLTYGLALGLFLRAIGDFRLVGFFKRVRGSRFAHLDTLVFSPLCLALAVGVFSVGYIHAT